MSLRIFALGLIFSLASLLAQQTTATLTGTVTDSTGATVPGAVVKVVSSSTNAIRDTRTDESGNYNLPFLPSGDYAVTLSSKGFQTQSVTGLNLQVGQTLRQDFQLKIGDVTETVSVAASSAILQTDNAVVGTVIDAAKVSDLPLNGRNFVQLAQLIPGVQAGTPGSITVRRGRGSIGQTSSAYGETAMSANGQRDTANRFFLDGIEIMDYDAMSYSFSPSVDSLSEFKVETSTYGAEAGGAPGGYVNIISKRGSNQLHGTLWEFNRNNALTQSYDAIANKDVTPPRLNRNQFGANVGGPVFLPKLYRGIDKTFFFFNWEQGRLLQATTPGLRIVPPTAYRNGDFSQLTNARTGEKIILRDPMGVGPFPNNQIPSSLLSPQAKAFLPFTPNPNTSQGAFNFISATPSALSRQKNFLVRGDHNFSPKDSIYLRYAWNDTFEAGIPFWGNDQRDNLGSVRTWGGGYVHTFSPTLVNDFKGGTHSFAEFENFGTSNKPEFDIAGKMGLPLVSRRPFEYGPPSISISGNDGGFSVFDLQRQIGPRQRSNSITQFADILSWQHGKHFLKAGIDLAIREVTFDQARAARGAFGFDGTYTGAAMADFMLGYVKTSSINPTPTATRLKNLWQSYFFSDDWRPTSRLTVNVGLRYDYFGKYTQADDKFVNIGQNGMIVTDLITPQNSKYGRGLIRPDKNNWGPRFGFAYRPTFADEMVIRGGYGLYYTPQISNAIFAMAEGAQATSGAALIGSTSTTPNIFFNNPFALAQTSGALNFAVSNDPEMRDSYIQQWNLNIQKKVFANIVIDAGYVGSKGTRLLVTFGDMNRPIEVVDPRTPGLASLNSRRPDQLFQRAVTGDKSIGNSIYHALQVKAERRLAKGATFLAAYTWSHAISGPSDIGGQVGGGNFIGAPQDIFNLRNDRSTSGFDLRHRFVNTILYELPFFKNSKGIARSLLGGWNLSTIMTFQGGYPAPVSANIDTTGTGINSRPDQVAGQNGNLAGGDRTWAKWINTNAFLAADPVRNPTAYGRFGTSPRTDAVRLPGITNFDFSVNKQFRLGETRRLEFRTEIFNLFNNYNPDPGTLDLNVRSATFGSIGGGVQGITTRVIQLGAKLYF
ncbi:carboxypeptidase-like regulatory domain-containing protein [Bryobacter aggregatus]|uniref:carboxypeptidase-like regulatory domain-containing protein n=1 Tax=Bryobacter aggregatus TaxID=360054 RepID=UPI00068DA2E8|nr:carboxypeptidase-like regulatory domain-containing protein [Bryobacter aggregatus]